MSDYKEYAVDYDEKVKEFNSYLHDVLFGMSYSYVKSNEKLLDLGIGTGLASINYFKLGLEVYGLDSSQEMLDVSKSKSFTKSLKLIDFSSDKIPFEDNYFDHVVCCGVLHFFGNLNNILLEVKRVLKQGGIFAFTIAPGSSNNEFTKVDTSWGIPIYKHSMPYTNDLLTAIGLDIQKEQRLLIKGSDNEKYNMSFSAIVAISV